MEIKAVTTLPVLDQNLFLPLPKIPANRFLVIYNSPWQNAEKEFAAAGIIDICMAYGQWQPVSAGQIGACITANPLIIGHLTNGVANALRTIVEEGLVTVIKHQEVTYFIPTPEFAKLALTPPSKLQYT